MEFVVKLINVNIYVCMVRTMQSYIQYVQHEATKVQLKAQEVMLHAFFLVYRLFMEHMYFLLLVHIQC